MIDTRINKKRIEKLNKRSFDGEAVCYWMNRECRVDDNHSLLFAQDLAEKHEVPLVVVYNLEMGYNGGGKRQHVFKTEGLEVVAENLADHQIPFFVLSGTDTEKKVTKFIQENNIGAIVTDFHPLDTNRKWIKHLKTNTDVPFYEVDAHNIVPCRVASDKQEYAARTIRPKIHDKLDSFLVEYPQLHTQKHTWSGPEPQHDFQKLKNASSVPKHAPAIDWLSGGSRAAKKQLQIFLDNRLKDYAEKRNDPNKAVLSNMSPFLHYGHISAQRIAVEVESRPGTRRQDKEAYLEELIVRKELTDNYCFYNDNYDALSGAPDWAQKTLKKHKDDEREYIYTKDEFEEAQTHDPLWNAAQMQMVKTGKMHGYMRMYWGKKILEWTNTPQYALRIAIKLNDRYELDGRDPNGYVGCMWSIAGVHDRAWQERDIFGKVRYMSKGGCERKFDTDAYIESVQSLE